MYKKILLAIVAILSLGTFDVAAQSANRRGFFIEAAGGPAIGTSLQDYISIPIEDSFYYNYYYPSYKGGFELGFGVGYQLSTSSHWATRFMLGYDINCSEPSAQNGLKLIIGERWFSNDFGNSMSFYLQPQFGFQLNFMSDCGFAIPVGVDLGLNFTPHLYCGLEFQYLPVVCGKVRKDIYGIANHDYERFDWQSHATAKLKLGYRF